MLDFAVKISQHRDQVSEADIDRLRGQGFSDADILHIIMWTANFNLANTLTAGVGLEPHENMSALFVEAPPEVDQALHEAPGPAGNQETVRPGWERAVVRPLEGLDLPWLNSAPLTWADLRGRVLLVSFWDVMHPNSLLALPYWQQWHDRYGSQGALMLGVHTGELAPAKDPDVVAGEIRRLGLTFPIALDATYRRMMGANNRFWPATQLVDGDGFVRFRSYGPGNYESLESNLRALLADDQQGSISDRQLVQVPLRNQWLHPEGMPDLYASFQKGSHRYGIWGPPGRVQSFESPSEMETDTLYATGQWLVHDQYMALADRTGCFSFRYRAAREVNVLVGPSDESAVKLTVLVDGAPATAQDAGADLNDRSQVTIDSPRVYQLLKHPETEAHSVSVEVCGKGARVYRFSFLPFRGEME